jgi:hypothetical protein
MACWSAALRVDRGVWWVIAFGVEDDQGVGQGHCQIKLVERSPVSRRPQSGNGSR